MNLRPLSDHAAKTAPLRAEEIVTGDGGYSGWAEESSRRQNRSPGCFRDYRLRRFAQHASHGSGNANTSDRAWNCVDRSTSPFPVP